MLLQADSISTASIVYSPVNPTVPPPLEARNGHVIYPQDLCCTSCLSESASAFHVGEAELYALLHLAPPQVKSSSQGAAF